MVVKKGDNYPPQSGGQLNALIIIGRIMVFVPIAVSIIILASTGYEYGGEILNSSAAGIATVLVCGVVTLIYVAFKRFKEGLGRKI